MFVIIAVASAVALAIWYFLIQPLSYWTRLGVKQTKPWILFGDSHNVFLKQSSFNDFISKIYNMHPGSRYIEVYNFNSPVLAIREPELIKQVTIKDFDYFTDHPPFVDPDADPIWSSALLSLKGERWKEIRNTLSPTYTSAKVKSLYTLMSQTAEDFVKHFLEKEDEITEIEMKETFSRVTNDIIATTAFGVQVNSFKDNDNTFYKMGRRLTEFTGIWTTITFLGHQVFPKLFKFLGVPFLDVEAKEYFYSVIRETLKARKEKNIIRNDMINILLEARKEDKSQDTGTSKTPKISNDDIISQAMIFFFAGFDTVSTTMCYSSYELAVNKDIQDRLRSEIVKAQKDGEVSYDDLMQMKYMDMVISEVLRKWPPFPFHDRLCTKPYTIQPINKDETPVPIKVDQEIWIPIYGMQRDPKYFPNPDQFDPERFSDKNKSKIVPYTYLPFGVGPRSCIGNRFALLEIKILLVKLLLNYEIVPVKKTPVPIVIARDFSQLPANGFWIGLKRIRN